MIDVFGTIKRIKGAFMDLIPANEVNKTDLVPTTGPNQIALVGQDNDVVIYQGNPTGGRGIAVQVRPKPLKICGKVYNVDPQQLIRMIKQVTQTIGEYKDKDNPYAGYVIGALRKARSDMVSDLEEHFRIHWQIDESSGRSVFYM